MDRITASKVFVAIVEHGNMTSAADALDMSRSMVTRYLTEMENWANTRLIHRSTRNLSLTNAGEKVLVHCKQLEQIADEFPFIDDKIDKEPEGLLRISCAQFMAQKILGSFISKFLDKHPKVSIDLHVSNHAVNLVKERIDLAIRITNDLDPNIIAKPLGFVYSVVCASPGYLEKHGIPDHIDQLIDHNCLTYSYFGKSIWEFTYDGGLVSSAVEGNLSANESMVLLNATLSGAGISLQPRYAIEPYLLNGELVELLTSYQAKPLGVYGIFRSRRSLSPALRLLLDELLEHFSLIKLRQK